MSRIPLRTARCGPCLEGVHRIAASRGGCLCPCHQIRLPSDPEQIVLRIPGEAAPQGSKTHLRGRQFRESSKRVKPWRAVVASIAEERWAGAPLIDGPVRMDVLFVFARPVSHLNTKGTPNATGRRTPFPYSRGDLDKLMRAIGDALTDVVYTDDKLVVSAGLDKRWAEPGAGSYTEITVTTIPVDTEEG